jgi:CBS domain-containing protein
MTVGNILKFKGNDVVTVSPSDSVAEVVRTLARHRIGCVVVHDGATVAGVFSERDFARAVAEQGAGVLDHAVKAHMTSRVVTCTSHDTIDDIMEAMTRGRFRHIPVVDDDQLIGIISIGDVVRRKIETAELEVISMREYIATG